MLKQGLSEALKELRRIFRLVLSNLLDLLKVSWFKGHSPLAREETRNEMVPDLTIITVIVTQWGYMSGTSVAPVG